MYLHSEKQGNNSFGPVMPPARVEPEIDLWRNQERSVDTIRTSGPISSELAVPSAESFTELIYSCAESLRLAGQDVKANEIALGALCVVGQAARSARPGCAGSWEEYDLIVPMLLAGLADLQALMNARWRVEFTFAWTLLLEAQVRLRASLDGSHPVRCAS